MKHIENLKNELTPILKEISEALLCEDSKEVAVYICRQTVKQQIKCEDCIIMCASKINTAAKPSLEFLQLLSHGGLLITSSEIKHYICNCFAILKLVEHILLYKFSYIPVRRAAHFVLLHFGSSIAFSCLDHLDSTASLVSKIIVNVYFNNKQKFVNDTVQKHQLSEFKKHQQSNKH